MLEKEDEDVKHLARCEETHRMGQALAVRRGGARFGGRAMELKSLEGGMPRSAESD